MWLPPRVNLTDTLFPYTSRHPPVARGHAEPAAERLAEGGQVAIAATQRDLADVERGFAQQPAGVVEPDLADIVADREAAPVEHPVRSEEHTSELQSLMRISYAVFCLKKKKKKIKTK